MSEFASVNLKPFRKSIKDGSETDVNGTHIYQCEKGKVGSIFQLTSLEEVSADSSRISKEETKGLNNLAV